MFTKVFRFFNIIGKADNEIVVNFINFDYNRNAVKKCLALNTT